MMTTRTFGVAWLLAAGLALTGCAAQSMEAPSSQTTAPSSTPMPESTGADEPQATAGAYLDYTDGVIEQTAGPKVLFFHAAWCPQCRQLDEQLTAEGAPDGLTVFKVDYDTRTDLRQRYGVTLQTTVVFVDDQGELISSKVLYDDPSIASLIAATP